VAEGCRELPKQLQQIQARQQMTLSRSVERGLFAAMTLYDVGVFRVVFLSWCHILPVGRLQASEMKRDTHEYAIAQ